MADTVNEFANLEAIEKQKQFILASIKEIMVAMEGLASKTANIKIGGSGSKGFAETTNAIKEVTDASSKLAQNYAKLTDQEKKEAEISYKIVQIKSGALDTNIKLTEQLKKETAERKKIVAEMQNSGKEYEVSLKKQLRDYQAQLAKMELAGKANTAEYKNMSVAAGKLKDAIGDAAAKVRIMSSDTLKLDMAISVFKTMASAAQVAQGAVALLGIEDENVTKSIQRMMAIQTLISGVERLRNDLQSESLLRMTLQNALSKVKILTLKQETVAITENTEATAGNTAAQTSNSSAVKEGAVSVGKTLGIWGLVLAAIASVGYAIYKYTRYRKEATAEEIKANAAQKVSVDLAEQQATAIDDSYSSTVAYVSILKDENASLDQKKIALEKVDEATGSNFSSQTDLNQAIKDAIPVGEKYLEYLTKKAELEANISVLTSYLQKDIELQTELESASAGFGSSMAAGVKTMVENAGTMGEMLVNPIKYFSNAKNVMAETYKNATEISKKSIQDEIDLNEASKNKIIENIKELSLATAEFGDIGKKTTSATTEAVEELTLKEVEHLSVLETVDAEIKKYNDLLNESISIGDVQSAQINSQMLKDLQAYKESIELINEALTGVIEKGDIITGDQSILTNKWLTDQKQSFEDATEAANEYNKTLDDLLNATKEFGSQVGQAMAEAIKQGDDVAKAAAKASLLELIKMFKNYIEAKIALEALASPESVATAGIAGLAKAAIMTGIVETIYAILVSQLSGYEKGRKGGPAELAIVGEVGTEAIVSGGKTVLTPNKPSLAYLPAGADVIPHDQLMKVMYESPNLSFAENIQNAIEIERVVSALGDLKSTIANKKEAHFIIDKSGIRTLIKNGNSWTKYIDNIVRL